VRTESLRSAAVRGCRNGKRELNRATADSLHRRMFARPPDTAATRSHIHTANPCGVRWEYRSVAIVSRASIRDLHALTEIATDTSTPANGPAPTAIEAQRERRPAKPPNRRQYGRVGRGSNEAPDAARQQVSVKRVDMRHRSRLTPNKRRCIGVAAKDAGGGVSAQGRSSALPSNGVPYGPDRACPPLTPTRTRALGIDPEQSRNSSGILYEVHALYTVMGQLGGVGQSARVFMYRHWSNGTGNRSVFGARNRVGRQPCDVRRSRPGNVAAPMVWPPKTSS